MRPVRRSIAFAVRKPGSERLYTLQTIVYEWQSGLSGGVRAIHGFIKEDADGVFDPETLKILTQAFDDAWARVQTSKAPYVAEEYANAGRTIIAKHIIRAAKAGERDPRWLTDSALLYLARQKLSRTPPKNLT
jgi:hypothetical protein